MTDIDHYRAFHVVALRNHLMEGIKAAQGHAPHEMGSLSLEECEAAASAMYEAGARVLVGPPTDFPPQDPSEAREIAARAVARARRHVEPTPYHYELADAAFAALSAEGFRIEQEDAPPEGWDHERWDSLPLADPLLEDFDGSPFPDGVQKALAASGWVPPAH
jgi:hypothetical protein